eukprot:5866433-Prorocentrum_lima.AAC.1
MRATNLASGRRALCALWLRQQWNCTAGAASAGGVHGRAHLYNDNAAMPMTMTMPVGDLRYR